MLNQAKKQEKVFKQVFTAQNILKARHAYEFYTDKYLQELNVALENGDSVKAHELKKKLTELSKNLTELKEVPAPTFSFGEVVQLTAPVRRKDVKERIFTQKNIEQSLKIYSGYVDIYLDNLNTALKNGDDAIAQELKSELEALRVNISDLKNEVSI
ncbi:hypothetical protein JMA_42970 (plasmid) [Jeotgalibacillus malaysiensis]|uniref:Uncharacterized protein n=1 Tax=Jeotgalibacillus malaysiensis TaxID=1508404 RepID=A0A0B5B0A3_9BACL|nr:hypothetical protein [Jeotgalibacillus malaysiensis]AJD93614.1 hypothetical protein JMA_42970 [Jeotgalibacillus malaysiensis]